MTAPVYDYVILRSADSLPDRPFTDVSLNSDDVRALRYMARRLNDIVNGTTELPAEPRPLILEWSETADKYFRIVLCDEKGLTVKRDLYCVGFFGQKRRDADSSQIEKVDAKLLGELAGYPAVLAYCSVQLDDGNFGNLVVLDIESERERWRENGYHQYAVAELTPHYYESVRLHNGKILGGLGVEPNVQLLRTKYYDYQNGFWCGLREMI